VVYRHFTLTKNLISVESYNMISYNLLMFWQ